MSVWIGQTSEGDAASDYEPIPLRLTDHNQMPSWWLRESESKKVTVSVCLTIYMEVKERK